MRNPVKISTTKFFQGSDLESELLGFGAVRLEIPALLSDTRNHLRSREIQLGRGLSPAEALKNPRIQLDMAHRIVLEQWLAELFERFDAAASHLVPTAKAKALKPARAREVIAPKRRISGVNLVKAEGEDDWRYWKAAISCLPTEETRDATKLDAAIHSGWREVNAAKLAERVHAELEATLLQPIAIQCRQLGNRPPRP